MTVSGKIRLRTILLVSAVALLGSTPALSQEKIFDEMRFGANGAINKSRANNERGFNVSGMFFLDPFDSRAADGWSETLLRPRIYIGGSVNTSGEANLLYGGFSWTKDVTEKLFVEVGLGGTLHDGDRKPDGMDGPKLGCPVLFREYAAAGYRIDNNWSVVAQVEHASHANLCEGLNNGLSRAGVMIGYRF